jgi:hypothetical protein
VILKKRLFIHNLLPLRGMIFANAIDCEACRQQAASRSMQ